MCSTPPTPSLPDPASRRLAHASFRLTAVTYSKLFPPCWSIIRGIVFYLKLRVRTLLTHSLEGNAFESDWKEEHEDFMCRCQASCPVHVSIKKKTSILKKIIIMIGEEKVCMILFYFIILIYENNSVKHELKIARITHWNNIRTLLLFYTF